MTWFLELDLFWQIPIAIVAVYLILGAICAFGLMWFSFRDGSMSIDSRKSLSGKVIAVIRGFLFLTAVFPVILLPKCRRSMFKELKRLSATP